VLTALAAITYYWRRVLSSLLDAVTLGILPLAASAFLSWVVARSLQSAPPGQFWSLTGVMAAGIVLMIAARTVQRSPFFSIQRESDPGNRAMPRKHAAVLGRRDR
jgi:hypothetical protein